MIKIKKGKRAYSVTTSEMSASFFFIAMIIFCMGLAQIMKANSYLSLVQELQVLTGSIGMGVITVGISVIFFFLAMVMPNAAISKNNLNILIDRITNPDFIGWIRFDRNHKIHFHTVEADSYGRTKGLVNDKNADVVNNGTYTVTAANGNQLIVVNDFLSHNKDLNECVGWSLVKKHHGILGYDVYRKAVALGETIGSSSDDSSEDDEGEWT